MKFVLLGLLLTVSGFLSAFQCYDSPDQIEEMHMHKWQILVTEAQLTPKEIEAVHPVFMEYESSVWKLHQQKRDFFKSALKNAKNIKPNYAELNDRYVEYEFKEVQLFRNYHLQLRKLMEPETLFKYYKAERSFKRKLLQDLPGHKPHDNK